MRLENRKGRGALGACLRQHHRIREEKAAFVVYNDITERKRAEEALRDSLETASAMLNAATESFALIDSEGLVLAANETFARRLGRPLDGIIGTSIYGYLEPIPGGAPQRTVRGGHQKRAAPSVQRRAGRALARTQPLPHLRFPGQGQPAGHLHPGHHRPAALGGGPEAERGAAEKHLPGRPDRDRARLQPGARLDKRPGGPHAGLFHRGAGREKRPHPLRKRRGIRARGPREVHRGPAGRAPA